MSGLDLFAVQETIYEYVVAQFPNYPVTEDGFPDDEQIIQSANQAKNSIILGWGTLLPGSSYSVAGARYDEYYSTVDINVISAVSKQARSALSLIVDGLTGFQPAGGEMAPRGIASNYTVRDSKGTKSAYIATQRMRFPVNTEGVGDLITP